MTNDPETLAARLTALEDRQEIADLISGYGPAVDALQGEAAAAIWTETGRYEVGEQWSFEGRDRIAALTGVEQHRNYVENGVGHVLSPHKIVVESDRARAFGYSMVVRHDAGDGWRIDRLSANRWEFARTPEGWRAVMRRAELLDGAAEAQALLGWAQGKESAHE